MRGLLITVAIGLASSALAAGQSLCDRPLKAATPDFGLMHNAALKTGVDDEILVELRRRSGCHIDVEDMPVNRALRMVEQGALDMQFSAAQLPGRERFGYFANYGALKNEAIMRSGAAVDSLDAFLADRRLNVGVLRGGTYGPRYDAAIATLRTQGRVFDAADVDQLFGWFDNKRIDLILAESVLFVPRLKALGLSDGVTIRDWVPGEKPLVGGLILSKRSFSAEQAQAWQGLMRDMRRDGTLRRIYLHFMTERYADSALMY